MTTTMPQRTTYLAIGQDLFSIDDYVREQYNYTLHHYPQAIRKTTTPQRPSIAMVYTDLQSLRGLDQPVDYGSGVEYADGLRPMALQIGLWLNGTEGCRDVLQGRLEESLQRLRTYLCDYPHWIWLRIGYEFDNPQFGYDDPEWYKQAFRVVAEQQCDNVYSVWHSWAADRGIQYSLDDYYPGDDVVDWVGISVFQQFFPGQPNTIPQVLAFVDAHQKPTMIAESTPFGGIQHLADPWKNWFAPTLDLMERYNIGLWSYIHCDWDAQPMWHGVGFGNSRLVVNATVQRLWNEQVLENPRFQVALLDPPPQSLSVGAWMVPLSIGDHAMYSAVLVMAMALWFGTRRRRRTAPSIESTPALYGSI